MNSCAPSPNATIGSTDITWAQASTHALRNSSSTNSYLRPDTGGALLPWIYTVVLIILHLPVVIIRVVRWEVVQSWCLVASFFSVVVYTQAYVSTQFDPAKVLVWTPIILVIDAGSMLQVFFLVIEAKKVKVGNRIVLMDPEGTSDPQEQATLMMTHELKGDTANLLPSQVSSSLLSRWRNFGAQQSQPSTTVIGLGSFPVANGITPNTATKPLNGQLKWFRDPATYSAICAAALFIAILILQILGLAKASAAHAASAPPLVSFCSPFFQPFGLAVVDGDCHVYDVVQSEHRGIGCVLLPGIWQQQWLKGTIAGISIELVVQFIDILILVMVNGSSRWKGIKMKRPWGTIFSGIVVLIVTLLYGVFYASTLPASLTTRVTVVTDIEGPASYVGTLTSAGLRGTIIGWNDGVFSSWNATYFGTWQG